MHRWITVFCLAICLLLSSNDDANAFGYPLSRCGVQRTPVVHHGWLGHHGWHATHAAPVVHHAPIVEHAIVEHAPAVIHTPVVEHAVEHHAVEEHAAEHVVEDHAVEHVPAPVAETEVIEEAIIGHVEHAHAPAAVHYAAPTVYRDTTGPLQTGTLIPVHHGWRHHLHHSNHRLWNGHHGHSGRHFRGH